MGDAQTEEIAETGASIVWSPSSNVACYDRTMSAEQVRLIFELGITMALAPDWTVSGEDEMLSEMRFAQALAVDEGLDDILAPEQLWRMVTIEAAEAVDLADAPESEDRIGQLVVGYRADIAVFGREGENPYQAVIDSYTSDVRLVLIDGAAYYGDENLEDVTAVNEFCEWFEACGSGKFLCVQNTPQTIPGASDSRAGETLESIHTQLYNILEGIGYPEEEQYGRGDELLELVTSCPRTE